MSWGDACACPAGLLGALKMREDKTLVKTGGKLVQTNLGGGRMARASAFLGAEDENNKARALALSGPVQSSLAGEAPGANNRVLQVIMPAQHPEYTDSDSSA
jgi:hypothetical protein